jgi:hypothetical protein
MIIKENKMSKRLLACSLTILMAAAVVFAHGDATHIMGTVSVIQGDHVTVKLQDGKTQMVMFDKATKYLTADNKKAKKEDMKVGTRVVIDAKMDEKMKMYQALEVRMGVTENHAEHK